MITTTVRASQANNDHTVFTGVESSLVAANTRLYLSLQWTLRFYECFIKLEVTKIGREWSGGPVVHPNLTSNADRSSPSWVTIVVDKRRIASCPLVVSQHEVHQPDSFQEFHARLCEAQLLDDWCRSVGIVGMPDAGREILPAGYGTLNSILLLLQMFYLRTVLQSMGMLLNR